MIRYYKVPPNRVEAFDPELLTPTQRMRAPSTDGSSILIVCGRVCGTASTDRYILVHYNRLISISPTLSHR